MTHQKIGKAVIFLVVTVLGSCTLNAQVKNDEADKKVIQDLRTAFVLEKMLKDKRYIFRAQTYSASSVGVRQLIPNEYDIQIKKDSVIVSLPYFGQSYSAQASRVDGSGIKMTSTKFDYSAVEKKDGKWLVSIKPKDSREVQLLFLTIFTNGTTMLQVTSTNREAITYNGYVMSL
jgi:hypothetical protein